MAISKAAKEIYDEWEDVCNGINQLHDREEELREDLIRLAVGQKLKDDDVTRFVVHPSQYIGWDCPNEENRIGTCIYDRWEDPALDSCLFCGDPYERK